MVGWYHRWADGPDESGRVSQPHGLAEHPRQRVHADRVERGALLAVYARINDSVAKSSFLKRAIFNWAIEQGRAANVYRERNEPLPPGLAKRVARADKLVFGKLKARVGGRLRFFVSGGAALSREIEEFFWAAGITILQGYGLTETAPVCNVNLPHQIRFGSVGRTVPLVTCKVETAEWVPAKPRPFPEGEICYKVCLPAEKLTWY